MTEIEKKEILHAAYLGNLNYEWKLEAFAFLGNNVDRKKAFEIVGKSPCGDPTGALMCLAEKYCPTYDGEKSIKWNAEQVKEYVYPFSREEVRLEK